MISESRFPKLRYAAWLSAGVVSVMILMNLSAALVMRGHIGGGAPIAAFTIVCAAVIGSVLAKNASTKDALIFAVCIALYRPALYLLAWPVALVQDLIRNQGLPGESLNVVMALNPQVAPFLVILITAAIIFISSRIVRKIFNSKPN